MVIDTETSESQSQLDYYSEVEGVSSGSGFAGGPGGGNAQGQKRRALGMLRL